MNSRMRICNPVAPSSAAGRLPRRSLETLAGKVVGFIDNGKPNFNYLVDDLSDLLVKKYGVALVVKHRKRGQVPAGDSVIDDMTGKCDAIITGSGD